MAVPRLRNIHIHSKFCELRLLLLLMSGSATSDISALGASLGAIELGILFATMLYGVMVVQCYTYHREEFRDGWPTQALVRPMSYPRKHLLISALQVICVLFVQDRFLGLAAANTNG